MSVVSRESVAAELPIADPRWLDTDAGPALILRHPVADGVEPTTATLICPLFGWQEDCAYRSLRSWAQQLAADGYPTARLVLPGTGDSSGGPDVPDLVEIWIDTVARAADALRADSGAQRVVAIGVGLGGLLTLCAAVRGTAIDDLVLWAVPRSGRRLLRELRAHSEIIAAEFSPDDAVPPASEDGDLILVGYRMTAATARDLSAIDLTALRWPSAERHRVLLLGREQLGIDERLRRHLESEGAQVTVQAGEDYGILVANPQQSRAPAASIARTRDWLTETPVPTGDTGASAATESPRDSTPMHSESAVLSVGSDTVRETALSLPGPKGELFAILTEPLTTPSRGVCAIFLGGGAVPHCGPNRCWAEAARRWASWGVPSVRVDLSGIGEAAGADPELLSDANFYAPWRQEEVVGVCDGLQERGVADRFVLGGLCSGAYRSLQGALGDQRIVGALLINLYAFSWSPELVTERGRRNAVTTRFSVLVRQPFSREYLIKALRYIRPDNAWRLLRRSVERRQREITVQALDELNRRDVETLLLLGRNEPLLAALDRQRLIAEASRWPSLTIERIPSRDHMFRASELQRYVHERLDAAMTRILTRHATGVDRASGSR